MTLDELERLEKAATPGLWYEDEGGSIGTAAGTWIAQTFSRRDKDFDNSQDNRRFIAAARNAMPALLAVARAARRYAAIDDLPCDFVDLEEGEPCPGIEENGGPCHWCELRAALDALE